ncbi:MAG: hypothetical protein SVR94_10925, partial [Pseudomonadota bacterium]|nr:hypothetical protein [Pseudomonadota bacterium]
MAVEIVERGRTVDQCNESKKANNMIALPGYTATKELYTNDKMSIYRGHNHDKDPKPVIIKILKTEYLEVKDIQFLK